MPARYQQTPAGQWRCPPGEAYAEPLGLTYRVRSSAEYHPLYIQNLKFLQDFWAHPVVIPPEHAARVLGHVTAHPGVRLTDLLAACPTAGPAAPWALAGHPACRPRPPVRPAARRSAVAHGLDRPRCWGDRSGENAPSHRVFVGRAEIGAA